MIEAQSLEDAEKFAREDPYTVHGVFERVEVHPWTSTSSTSGMTATVTVKK